MSVLRSMLFVPGNNLRMIVKACTLTADAVILDLEDAVPLGDKPTARVIVRDSVQAIRKRGMYVFVRVNALPTGLTTDDLESIILGCPDGIMLAKTESKDDVVEVSRIIREVEKREGLELGIVKMVALIESAKGIINAREIAFADKRMVAMAFGAGDYCRDLGRNVSFLTPQQTELLYARSHLVNCSVAAGIQSIDTTFFGLLTDTAGFAQEAALALQLGFNGKLCIHPSQLSIVNATFAPSPGEIDYAHRLVEAFEEAQAKGVGAISFEGKMVDGMNYQQSRALTTYAASISAKQKQKLNTPYVSLSEFFTAASVGETL
jgi:citrate lyase subunit beta/citryl-CoA lyase